MIRSLSSPRVGKVTSDLLFDSVSEVRVMIFDILTLFCGNKTSGRKKMSYCILIADDEAEIRDVLHIYLEQEGYDVLEAADGVTALNLFQKEHIDMALLDIMMPGLNGYRVLKTIRETSNIPVIMISAKISESDKVLGLDMGADDYITKPFQPMEAMARIRSNLRRFYSLGAGAVSDKAPVYTVRNLSLDTDTCSLTKDGTDIQLTGVEYKLMELFMAHPGKVFTKQQIYEAGWGDEYFDSDNNIMVSISKLRAKLDEDQNAYIKTIRGLGYRLQ